MHPEEKVHERLIGNNVGIESNLNSFGVPRSPRTNLIVGRLCGVSTSIADNNLVELVRKMFTIELFGAWNCERNCRQKDVPQKQPYMERNVSNYLQPGREGCVHWRKQQEISLVEAWQAQLLMWMNSERFPYTAGVLNVRSVSIYLATKCVIEVCTYKYLFTFTYRENVSTL